MTRWVGVDMSESCFSASLIGERGGLERKWRVGNDPEDRRSWLASLISLGELTLVLETTESFSERLAAEALSAGIGVHVAPSSALKYFRRSEGFEDKSDDLDGYLLGLMGYRGVRAVRPAVVRTSGEQRLRALERLRERLVHRRVALGQQLRGLILSLSPEVAAGAWKGPKVTSATFLAVLGRWPDLRSLNRARFKTVVDLVKRAGRSHTLSRAEEIAQALRQWAYQLETLSAARIEPCVLELRIVREHLELLDRQIKSVERELEGAVTSHPRGEALLGMHEIDTTVAARLLAEEAPRMRALSEPQLANFSGLTPASRSSGKSEKSRLRRSVDKRLAAIHFTSAVASLRPSSIDRAYYDKKRQDFRGHQAAHKKAVIALARQRHKVIFRILRGETYDEVRLATSTLIRARTAA